LHSSDFARRVAAFAPAGAMLDFASEYSLRRPWVTLTVKWILYLAAGFFIAAAAHVARPAVSALERPLQVRGFPVAREFLFALGFLLVVLLLSEPFLSRWISPFGCACPWWAARPLPEPATFIHRL
jgi:hypothetical protein